MSTEITYVDTLSGVNVSNGIVKLYFAAQDHAAALQSAETGQAPEAKPSRTIAMPMTGFLQATSVVNDLLSTQEMQAQIRRLVEAGVISIEEPEAAKQSTEEAQAEREEQDLKASVA